MKTNSKKIQFDLDTMYDVADVKAGYKYWFSKLLNVCLSIFEYDGLPASLPQREVELQLQLNGNCVIFLKNGELITTNVSGYDMDKYYQHTKGTYAQPVIGSGNLVFDSYNNVRIFNCSLQDNILDLPIDNSLRTFISRYARRLADVESTSNIYTVNNRATNYPVAKTDKVKDSIIKFFNQLSLGKKEVVCDDKIIEGFVVAPMPHTGSADDIIKWEDARDKILEQFYRDIGVKFRNNKRAQMSDEEVEADEQVLLISLDDMLKCRKEGLAKLNEKFGTNVTVKINPKFDRENYRKESVRYE